MKKNILLSAVLAAAMCAPSNVSAVMGTLTVSGTVKSQSYNKQGDAVIQTKSFNQKNLLLILEQGTGDTSIIDKPTTIYFDADAVNFYASNAIVENQNVNLNVHGIFYYSNSVSGLVRLDGTNSAGYYSYMEFDYTNPIVGGIEDFWNPAGMEANNIFSFSSSGNNESEEGNAILYVHSFGLEYNLLGDWDGYDGLVTGDPSSFFYANSAYNGPSANATSAVNGFWQSYAVVIHGPITFKASTTKDNTILSESFKLTGTGDMVNDTTNAVFNGTANYSGHGTNDLF